MSALSACARASLDPAGASTTGSAALRPRGLEPLDEHVDEQVVGAEGPGGCARRGRSATARAMSTCTW